MPDVHHLTLIYAELKRRIMADNPDLSEDDQVLIDTLEGETELPDVLIAVMRQADTDEALASGLTKRIAEMTERKARLGNRAEGRRALVLWAMQESGIAKIEAPEFTISTAKVPKSVVITDPSALPAEYWRQKDPEPDKPAIAKALKDGLTVSGAIMSNGGIRLSVRKA